MLKTISVIILVLFAFVALFILFGLNKLAKQSQAMTPQLGLTEGQFIACPNTPNCVSSQSTAEKKKVNAIKGGKEAFTRLSNHITADSTATVVSQNDTYLHAAYQTKRFGFIDDVELYLNGEIIDIRSASRVGKSDFGANRKRVESLRAIAN